MKIQPQLPLRQAIRLKKNPTVFKLFVFGTLRVPELVKHILGEYEPEEGITLHGYKLRDHGDNYEQLIEGNTGDKVEGDILYVNRVELQKLKDWEHERYQLARLPNGLYFFEMKR